MSTHYSRDTEDSPRSSNPLWQQATDFSATDFARAGAIRIMLPGHKDPQYRLKKAVELAGVVEQTCDEISALDALEMVNAPGTIQHEYCVVGYTNDRNHETAIEKALGNDGKPVTEYGEGTDPAPTTKGRSPTSIADKMSEIVDEGTPANIGVQTCEIDLSPLGVLPRPTSRLLLTENMDLTPIENKNESAVRELITTLNERRVPFVQSTIIAPAAESKSYDYLGTSRLVVFGTDNGIVTDDDLETFSQTVDEEFRISSYFGSQCGDNFGLPVESHLGYANQATSHPSAVEKMDDQSLRGTTIRDLKSGFPEYQSLLDGRMNADQRYRELFDAFGVLRLNSRDLLNFFVLEPAYFDVSPWGRSATADPMKFVVDSLGSAAEGTRQSYGTEQPGDTQQSLDNSNEESDEHQEKLSKWVTQLVRQGHEIIAIDQDSVDVDFEGADPTTNCFFEDDSRPDIVSRKNSQLYCHEIEIKNETKPSKLLTNLARGSYNGYPVIVVTASKNSARSKYIDGNNADRAGPLREPYRDVDSKGVICYNLDATVHPHEDETVLLPSSASQSRWRRTPDDRHQLVVDETVVAEGPADASVDTYTYNCPRVRKQGSAYVLESASGETIREQPTKKAAIGDLTKVRKPFPITQQHFLENTTVKYQSGDEFTEFRFKPEWAIAYKESTSRRYEVSVTEFIEKFTVEDEGSVIPVPVLRQQFLRWYGAQTDLSEPNDTWFGRAIPDTYDVDDSDTHNKKLENRAFRFSEGLISPDLPFIDDETDSGD